MEVQKAGSKDKQDVTTTLGKLSAGDVFRFQGTNFVDALYPSMAGSDSFFMVVNTQPVEAGRVSIVSVDGKQFLKRDESHVVIKHEAVLEIHEAAKF